MQAVWRSDCAKAKIEGKRAGDVASSSIEADAGMGRGSTLEGDVDF